MLPKILCIQFRENQQVLDRERACLLRETASFVDLDFVSATDNKIDWASPQNILAGYSGLVLGGSGDYDFDGNRDDTDPAKTTSYQFLEKLEPLFKYIFANDIPTLGICYGHQLLGAFAGAKVHCDSAQKKTRSHEVRLLVDRENHFLFLDLPESFYAHYGHKDSLDRVPEGAVLLMEGGEQCKVSALKYKNNIFSTQFHPELNFQDMINRIEDSPQYLPEGIEITEIFKDEPHSNTILRNFAKFVSLQPSAKAD